MNTAADQLNQLRIERKPGARKRKRKLWPWIVGALAVLVAALIAWSSTRPAEVQAVAARDAADPANASLLDASGFIVARRIATVSSKSTGRVREVMIEEGQRVEAGQVLATLDPIDADAQQALASAQLGASQSQIAQVEAQLVEAEASVRRLTPLVKDKLVSRQQYDQAVAQRDALRASLVSTRRNAEVANRQLDVASIGVDNTIVRAPFAGVITAKAAQPGEIVSPISAGGGFTRTGIGTVVDMASLEVQVDINEAFIGRVTPKQKVQAVLNAYPDWTIPAEVIAIVPTADRSKATVKVRIAFLQRDERIVPDMGVRVSFLEQAPAPSATAAPVINGVSIADEAVVERDGRTVVFVVGEGKARLREVQVEAARSGKRRVTRGLAVGEQVVLSPPENLRDGNKVRSEG